MQRDNPGVSPDARGPDTRLLTLLWRDVEPRSPRRGRPARLDPTTIVDAAIALADAGGGDALSMRTLAKRLGSAPMSLYTHVPGKAGLLVMMTDSVLLRMHVSEPVPGASWRDRLRLVADDNRALFDAHPWLLERHPGRPPLGPGLLAKYEWELSALSGLGLSARTMDSCLTFLLEFVRAGVADSRASRREAVASVASREDWWESAAPILERHVTEAEYPLATRVGTAAGAALGAPADADHAYRFGLDRVLDGIAALLPARHRVG